MKLNCGLRPPPVEADFGWTGLRPLNPKADLIFDMGRADLLRQLSGIFFEVGSRLVLLFFPLKTCMIYS
jgi:hypothetical protein